MTTSSPHTYAPFNHDMQSGSYLYTQGRMLSGTLSNARMTRAILKSTDLRNKNIVDIGCGDGSYSLELKSAGQCRSVHGLDPADEAIKVAQKNAQEKNIGSCSFEARDIFNWHTDTPFDVAIMRGVIHHLDRPEEAIHIALKNANRVVILEPNGLNPILKIIEKFSAYHRAHNEKSFCPTTIDRWIENGGGQILSREFLNLVPFFCPDFLAKVLTRLEPFFENIPLLNQICCGQYLVTAERKRTSGV